MQCVLFGRSRRTNFCPPPPPPKLLGPSPWLGRRTLSAAHLRICPLPSITFFWAYLREDYTDAFPDWAIAEITLVILHPRGLFAALFIPYTFTVVAQNGRHTIPNSKRKPKSERWSPETATTPMPKPTGCNTQYSPACAHISYSVHNPTCYYTPRTVHYYKYTATYVVRACTDPGHSVHGRGGRRPWCVEPGAGACVPEAES